MHQHTSAPTGDSDARLLEVLHGTAPGTSLGAPADPALAPADPDPDPASGAAALLLARHWQALHAYTALFTPSGRTAGMAAAAVFARLASAPPERPEPPAGPPAPAALRPRLLVEARRVLAEWARPGRVAAALPGVRAPAEPAESRRLVALAFHALPEDAQVLLWHREVEAEGLSVPAALLALDPREAGWRLDEARTLLRAGCADAHQALAPDRECRHFGRLLDLSLRRTGPLIPDIRRHLARCAFCRRSADQLRQADGRLPLLLAEAVLGGGAERYLETRPGRLRAAAGSPPGTGAHRERLRRAGRHARAVRRRLAHPALRRPDGGTLLTGLGFGLSALLLAAAVSGLWPAADGGDRAAGPQAPPTATAAPPPAPAGHPEDGAALRTRLRTAAPHGGVLCVDVRGGAGDGAALTLAACTGAVTQTWLHEPDGLLRSAAAPELCADSGRPDGSVALAVCRTGPEVRYDVTVRGAVVPRGDAALALAAVTAEPGSDLVVRLREAASEQRWLIDGPGGEGAAHAAGTQPAAPGPLWGAGAA
ncbi:ricin-type beta-trefoil lectin domain protein [Streptomyces sp. CC228A]|uniref:ricin-type beta-trefoil lectin domain protein n=1 Tax=Streptomyces sp. CC228A TaxID=2898186 RepID=UPI0022A88898|nr:ricin-type beta-trefoil lectin domain protein [Streptomyces sp. CC228A]